MKTIGNIIIEIGLLPKATVVPVEFWSVKDFQYDLLILQLNSAKIVASVLSTEKIEPDSYTDLAISILFDLVHLYYVNCEGSITSKIIVFMLWFSIIYKLHVDGIHITSK